MFSYFRVKLNTHTRYTDMENKLMVTKGERGEG